MYASTGSKYAIVYPFAYILIWVLRTPAPRVSHFVPSLYLLVIFLMMFDHCNDHCAEVDGFQLMMMYQILNKIQCSTDDE